MSDQIGRNNEGLSLKGRFINDLIKANYMRQRINKIVSTEINNFLIKEKTGSIKRTDFGTSTDLFKNIEQRKCVLGWLKEKGLNAWKRGTKEPARIKQALEGAKWDEVQHATPAGVSMWD